MKVLGWKVPSARRIDCVAEMNARRDGDARACDARRISCVRAKVEKILEDRDVVRVCSGGKEKRLTQR